jgi:LysM repeat protein
MNRTPVKKILIYVMTATWGLVACNSANSFPEQSQLVAASENELAVVEVVTTPTVTLPTASAPTATSTKTPPKAPPTATSTLTVRPAATATLTPTPPPPPPPVPTSHAHIYIIEEYDTLLGIAIEFDTTVEALIAANQIRVDGFLQIGQELIIPGQGQHGPVSSQAAAMTGQTEASAGAVAPLTEGVTIEGANGNEIIAVAGSNAVSEPAEDVVTAAGRTTETESITPLSPPAVPVPVGPVPSAITRAANINPLTGLPVDDPAKLKRRPLLIRVGNDVAARQSQVGLNSAEIIYEEIAEWWVTRFTAIFLAKTPPVVAPIRSARLINVQLAPQYQGALAHSGGSDPVRWEISQAPLINLDEYYNARPYFYRPNEGWQTRLGLDTVAAREYLVAKGTEAPVSLHGFLFSNSIDRGEPGQQFFIPYPRVTSRTEWHYDAPSGKYLRWVNETPLYDVGTGTQVAGSNVIVYFAEHQVTDIVEDSNGNTSIRIVVNGQGAAWFFRDGKLNKGFWQTDGTRTPYFSYSDGTQTR